MPEQPSSMPEILAPVPGEPPRATAAAPVEERRRPNVFALGLLAVGFGLAISAQYMPWGSFTLGSRSGTTDEEFVLVPGAATQRSVDVPLTYLSAAHVTVYLLTLAGALTALAVLLAVRGAGARRVASAVAGGLLAANLLVLVGFKTVIDHMGNSDFSFLLVANPQTKTGPGYPLAFAALVMLAAALVLAVRPVSAGSRRGVDEPRGGEPLELTVTPVPTTLQ
ncbi:hypothetical protein ACQP1P_46695 [Dactylosporangium sp. CA-052675]|uniref:hypothetical protein n=1 Tax=Dactylosporangium sp. CA-052675 TaxID=3239927 RepID=UPI003D8B99F9